MKERTGSRRAAFGFAALVSALVSLIAVSGPAGADSLGGGVPPLPARPNLPGFAERLDGSLASLATAAPSRRAGLARTGGLRFRDGRVTVEVLTEPGRTAAAAQHLRTKGATLGSVARGILEADVAVDELDALAKDPAVRYVQALIPPPLTAVTGQGVAYSNASGAHALGATGAGVKLMVIDEGYAGYLNSQASGDLPASLDLQNYCNTSFTAIDHGTNVAEIVHEIAPDAQLTLVCMDGYADQQLAEQYAVGHGIDVISRSLGDVNTARGDGSGNITTTDGMARDATAHGILWVNSAGNYARSHWSGHFVDANTNGYLDWIPGDDSNQVGISHNQTQCFYLKWDSWPTTAIDYNIRLYDPSLPGFVGSGGSAVQNGSQPPIERVCYTNAGASRYFDIYVTHPAGSGSPRIDMFATGAGAVSRAVAPGSVIDSVGSTAVLSVAAQCPFDSSLEPYSSQGPTIDGKVRPDLSGPAAVTTSLRTATDCKTGFGGTSAAAPHVAGAAALYKQALGLGPAGLHEVLNGTAIDQGPPGTDNLFGAGRLTLELGPCAGRRATIVGTRHKDVLRGTPGADVILGLESKDRLLGRAGKDRLCGGPGPDRLVGGAGRDRLLGQGGRDKLFGGPGRDRLLGGPGRDLQQP